MAYWAISIDQSIFAAERFVPVRNARTRSPNGPKNVCTVASRAVIVPKAIERLKNAPDAYQFHCLLKYRKTCQQAHS